MGVSNFISYNVLTAPASRLMGVFTSPSCTSADSMFWNPLQSTEIPIERYEILSVDGRVGYGQVRTRDVKVSSGRGGHAYSGSDSWNALLVCARTQTTIWQQGIYSPPRALQCKKVLSLPVQSATPEKSALSQNSCVYLQAPHKILM